MSTKTARSIQSGLILVALGSLILYANLQRDFGLMRFLVRCFPAIFVLVGIQKAVRYFMKRPEDPAETEKPKATTFSSPLLWIGFGTMLLFVTLGSGHEFWTVFGTYWPLLLILAGIGKVVDAMVLKQRVRLFAGEIVFLICVALFSSGLHHAFQNIRFLPEEIRSVLFHSYKLTASPVYFNAGSARVLAIAHEAGKVTLKPSTDGRIGVIQEQVIYTDSQSEAKAISNLLRSGSRVRPEGNGLVLESGRDDRAVVNLTVLVPPAITLQIDSDRGDVFCSSLNNPLELDVTSADVLVRDHQGTIRYVGSNNREGDFTLESVTGDVTVNGLRDADVYLVSINGNLKITDCLRSDVQVRTGTGELFIQADKSDVRVRDRCGNAKFNLRHCAAIFEGIRGTVSVENTQRTVKLIRPMGDVTVQNDGGDVILSGFPENPLAKLSLETNHGDVEIRSAAIPKDRKIHLYAMDGEIDTSFQSPPLTVTSGTEGPVWSNCKPEEAAFKCVTRNGSIRWEQQ